MDGTSGGGGSLDRCAMWGLQTAVITVVIVKTHYKWEIRRLEMNLHGEVSAPHVGLHGFYPALRSAGKQAGGGWTETFIYIYRVITLLAREAPDIIALQAAICRLQLSVFSCTAA